jgi:hypothetical protein
VLKAGPRACLSPACSEAAHEVGGQHRQNHEGHEDGGGVAPARRANSHGAVARPAAAHA